MLRRTATTYMWRERREIGFIYGGVTLGIAE
jgi:hypothetical protein